MVLSPVVYFLRLRCSWLGTDAQVVAAIVEALPDHVGGRRVATQIAEMARAHSAPDWGQGDCISITPCGWD